MYLVVPRGQDSDWSAAETPHTTPGKGTTHPGRPERHDAMIHTMDEKRTQSVLGTA